MNKLRDESYLIDILDSAKTIEEFMLEITFDDFLKDVMRSAAVTRFLEIIGEATKNLSIELREKYPDVSWKEMAGLRDILIHQYRNADDELVFQITTQNIPILISQIEKILKDFS